MDQPGDSVIRPKGENLSVFGISRPGLLKSDGSIKPANIVDEAELEMHKSKSYKSEELCVEIHISNLVIGDELELDYAYKGVFNNEPAQGFSLMGASKTTIWVDRNILQPNRIYYGDTMGRNLMIRRWSPKSKPAMSEFYFKAEKSHRWNNWKQAQDLIWICHILLSYKHKDDYGILDPKTRFVTKRRILGLYSDAMVNFSVRMTWTCIS